MFRVGTKVKVTQTNGSDPDGWGYDEDGNAKYDGKVGVVTGHDFEDVGATAKDPLHFVRFSPRKKDGFWTEELRRVRR